MLQASEIAEFKVGQSAFIFGGAYGNLQATKKILQKAKSLGFSKHQIVFTGDSVAYCAQPEETSNLIQNHVANSIMGNCEEALAFGYDDCGCGFEEGTACNLLSAQWYSYCQANISSNTKEWMSKLPKHAFININGYKLLCTHAAPTSINRFIFPSNLKETDFLENLAPDCHGFVVGHSGIPFVARLNNKIWVNSGASGMPANDGTPRVWYATIRASEDGLDVSTHSLEYDFADAQREMNKAGLNNGYMECLETGIWPSHDVLPSLEEKETGTPLAPQRIRGLAAKV